MSKLFLRQAENGSEDQKNRWVGFNRSSQVGYGHTREPGSRHSSSIIGGLEIATLVERSLVNISKVRSQMRDVGFSRNSRVNL